MIILCLNFLLLAYTCVFFVLRRKTMKSPVAGVLGLLGFNVLVSAGLSQDSFHAMALMCWGLFLHLPLFLAAFAVLGFKRHRRWTLVAIILTLVTLAVGTDAFLIEPHWLEVTHVTLTSDRLDEPVRMAVLADIQTDTPGEYEARVFARVKAEQPDLIVFLGDYIQANDPDFAANTRELNRLLREADLQAPLGMYAIQGNVDHGLWADIFSGLDVTTIHETQTEDLGPLLLTGLSFDQSFETNLTLQPREKYHLVLGHCPDFALGQTHANLMLAGHTHGGQVRLPGVAPLLTFSQVPRAWASGLTQVAPNQHLYVSRGIGMERGNAPRLRFLCRPELLILTLTPDASNRP
jgi:predicted MPP superfamily phosphohydrolase